MEQRVIDILQRNFADADVKISLDSASQKIGGVILWNGFARHDFLWRQNKLYRVLRREMGTEATVVSHIFTYTPHEYEVMMSVA